MGTRNIVQTFGSTDDDFTHLRFYLVKDGAGVAVAAQLRQEPAGGGEAVEPKCVLKATSVATGQEVLVATPNSVFTTAGVTRAQARAFLAELIKYLRTVAGIV